MPAGTKAKSDPATIILSALASAGVFTALIEALRAWTLRRESRRIKIRVERKDQAVEFDYSPTAVSAEELMEFSKQILDVLQDQEDGSNKTDLPDRGDD